MSDADKDGEGDKKGTDGTNDEDEGSEHPSENVHVNDGGKKDPLTRRKELLIDSGLAEVRDFYSWTSVNCLPGLRGLTCNASVSYRNSSTHAVRWQEIY